MRALTLQSGEDFRSLMLRDVPLPAKPAPGKVRIRVRAVGLNPVDYKISSSHPQAWQYPHPLGLDIAGEIVAGQTDFAPGTRVALHHNLEQPGGLAEFVDVDPHALARIPESVDFAAAAALPCAGLTAYQATQHRLHLGNNDVVLIVGASGAVGAFATQLAHLSGATVVATASTSKIAWVQSLGADIVLDYTAGDIWEQISKLNLRISAILDTVGTTSVDQGLQHIVHGGGLVHINGGPSQLPAGFQRAISIHEVALGAAYSHGDARSVQQLGQDLADLLELVATQQLHSLCYRTIGLTEVIAGYQDLYDGKVQGKIVTVL